MEYMDKIRAVEVFNFIVNGNLNNHKTCLLHLPFAYSTWSPATLLKQIASVQLDPY
jgi:hypothetical protein